MEFMEPKRGDRIFHGNKVTTIDSFSDDHGTFLRSGQWVDISDFEKNDDGVWVRTNSSRTYGIGETYRNSQLRKGVAVIRPAVFIGGAKSGDKVVTTSPCCTLNSRRLDFSDLDSKIAKAEGGWPEKCTNCDAHYVLSLIHTGNPRMGLYGVRWESRGF